MPTSVFYVVHIFESNVIWKSAFVIQWQSTSKFNFINRRTMRIFYVDLNVKILKIAHIRFIMYKNYYFLIINMDKRENNSKGLNLKGCEYIVMTRNVQMIYWVWK